MRKIEESIQINQTMIRNRIAMPPMATGKAVDGAPGEEMISYYKARAKGTGLIIVEHEYVSPEGKAHNDQLSMAFDQVIDGYRKLTDAVHAEGAAIIAQISHAGASARDTGLETIAPSHIPVSEKYAAPRPMTLEEIQGVKEAFVQAALRAKAAGFDGVEIHGAHGYLLNQFYSPYTNRRTDAYTGSTLEGRIRLQCEILKAIRKAAGETFIVGIRFGACDYREGGSKPEEIPAASKAFEEAGADLIDISGGLSGYVIPGKSEPGWFSDLSRLAKDATNIPVLVTGGITTGQQAEEILQRKDADLIGVGRALLKDPDWTLKALDRQD